MANAILTNLDQDGETRSFAAHGHAVIGTAGGLSLMKGVFEPGWRWSTDVAPLAGTTSCQTRHLGYVLSGTMQARMDDGTELTCGAGMLFDLAAGHDAWVVGDVACVVIDYSPQALAYATSRAEGIAAPTDSSMALVQKGYAAFNSGDIDTLRGILARDVVQHVPGSGPFAGTHKGIDAVLGYYGNLAEFTDGTFRAHLVETHGDGQGHVSAVHQMTATRNGTTRVSRGSILFTFVGERATDLLEVHADLPGDDAFFA